MQNDRSKIKKRSATEKPAVDNIVAGGVQE
jgi:hypothetical protein